MKVLRKCTAFLTAALLLTGCGAAKTPDSESSSESAVQSVEKTLVTLGDSISFGYGLDDVTTERYSALLKNQLESRDKITWNGRKDLYQVVICKIPKGALIYEGHFGDPQQSHDDVMSGAYCYASNKLTITDVVQWYH